MSKQEVEQNRSVGKYAIDSTGNPLTRTITRKIPFDRFEVIIRLSEDGQFLRIDGIGINKDFLSVSQRISSVGVHDVSSLYEDQD